MPDNIEKYKNDLFLLFSGILAVVSDILILQDKCDICTLGKYKIPQRLLSFLFLTMYVYFLCILYQCIVVIYMSYYVGFDDTYLHEKTSKNWPLSIYSLFKMGVISHAYISNFHQNLWELSPMLSFLISTNIYWSKIPEVMEFQLLWWHFLCDINFIF